MYVVFGKSILFFWKRDFLKFKNIFYFCTNDTLIYGRKTSNTIYANTSGADGGAQMENHRRPRRTFF
jgi:hypothetical protein